MPSVDNFEFSSFCSAPSTCACEAKLARRCCHAVSYAIQMSIAGFSNSTKQKILPSLSCDRAASLSRLLSPATQRHLEIQYVREYLDDFEDFSIGHDDLCDALATSVTLDFVLYDELAEAWSHVNFLFSSWNRREADDVWWL